MNRVQNFGLDHVDQSRFSMAEDSARAALDMAVMRSEAADLLYSLDHAIHCLFVGGDEPKWSHPVQREAVIEALQKMVPLLERLGLPS
jgi:hypothetical protein